MFCQIVGEPAEADRSWAVYFLNTKRSELQRKFNRRDIFNAD